MGKIGYYVKSEYTIPVPEKHLNFMKHTFPEKFNDMTLDYTYTFEDEDEYIEDRFEYVKEKYVYVDGWSDTYIMYYDKYEDQFVFVFDESDLYDDNFDWTCDNEREADEWFDCYNGDEEDEIVSSKKEKVMKKIKGSYNPYGTDFKWYEEDVTLYFDGEDNTFRKYTGKYKGNTVTVHPEYNPKSDWLSWVVYLNGKKLESFETSYDALDFCQFELVDMYLTPVRSSKKVSGRHIKCTLMPDGYYNGEDGPYEYLVYGYYDKNFYGVSDKEYFNDISEAEDFVWELVNKGCYVAMYSPDSERYFSPDKLEKSVEEFGEVYDITDAEIQW